MQELSLHILDIVQNSITAQATLIEVGIVEDALADVLDIKIQDNGIGMDDEKVKKVLDPFYTTRTTRRVGLGVPLYREAALSTGGAFWIESKVGAGTTVFARFGLSHIDRQPLGDIAGVMFTLVTCNPDIDFVYTHRVGENVFTADTREMKQILDGVPLSDGNVGMWLKSYLDEGISNLYGGA